MWLHKAHDDPAGVHHVAHNMREWDRREIFATRFDDDSSALADIALASTRVSWVAGIDAPIAAFGCSPMWPGVWSMWLFATDDFRHIGFPVTKLIVRSIVPMLFEAGAHRLEARSMEGHEDAQRWLEVIGAQREATLHGYGRDGQDFHVFTWLKPGAGGHA
jgi:RimJ/RimL family protein N-acetyltransferase